MTLPSKAAGALDPAMLTTFAATLANLPKEEIQKAKKLYILNAIADYKAQKASTKALLIVMGVMCIIPIFLIVFIPALIGFRKGFEAQKQKILNAIEVWQDDLGGDGESLRAQLEA
jgi:hypothetical protein